MIREPYNLNPYNASVDITQNPSFSFTFGGDALARAQLIIAKNNSDGTPLFMSGVSDEDEMSSYCPGTRNGEEVTLTPSLSPDFKNSIINNKDYIWRLKLTEDNTTFSYQCSFATDHLEDSNQIGMKYNDYKNYILNPMLNNLEDELLVDCDEVTKRLKSYYQVMLLYNGNYYRVLGVSKSTEDENIIVVTLDRTMEDKFQKDTVFLLYTNCAMGLHSYATQSVKQGRALSDETESDMVLTKEIPYPMSKVHKIESGVFLALSDHGTFYDKQTDYVIMGDNARIIQYAEDIVVDIPSTYDLTLGYVAESQLVLDNFAFTIKTVQESPEVGYYRFTCQGEDADFTNRKIVSYEIRGWDQTISELSNLFTEVEKIAYSYEDAVFTISFEQELERKIVAYEQWNYATGDLKGFIYYADFHLNWAPLNIEKNSTFQIKSNFYTSNWCYFQARKNPDIAVNCLTADKIEDSVSYISNRIATFQGFYNGYGITYPKSHRWIINKDKEIIYDSGTIYDTELFFRFEDFIYNGEYKVTLEIISQNDSLKRGVCIIHATDVEEVDKNFVGNSMVIEENQSIKLTWAGLLVTTALQTSGCAISEDHSYLHIPRDNYIKFDNVGGGPINIDSESQVQFEMKLRVNDALTYYDGDIFTLSHSATGQKISIYKQGNILCFRDDARETPLVKLFDVGTPEFGLQPIPEAKMENDYQWWNKENNPSGGNEVYWINTIGDTNVHIWTIGISISNKNCSFFWYRDGISDMKETTTISNITNLEFDTFNFFGDIDLFYFAYGEGTDPFTIVNGTPTWNKPDPETNLKPLIIFKSTDDKFISNPRADLTTDLSSADGVSEYVIYRTYKDNDREKIGSVLLSSDAMRLDSYSFYDWTCRNRIIPTYEIVPIGLNGQAHSPIKIEVTKLPEWYFWSFIELKTDGNHYVPGEIWNFHLNLEAGQYTQNIAKVYQQGFSATPKAIVGPTNYITTSLTGALADLKIIQGQWDRLYEINCADALKIEKWNDFVHRANLVLVKDMYGQLFIGNLSNNNYSIQDAGEMITSVTFDITEIDNIHKYQIFTIE